MTGRTDDAQKNISEPDAVRERQRKIRRRAAWLTATGSAVCLAMGGAQLLAGHNEDSRGRACNEATIRGDYGIQIQGTRPAPGGLTESVIGVVLRTYDGRGNIEQVDNVKGSITGITPDRMGVGTYEVHADCTGIARFQPAPGTLIEERMVIVDNGREIRTMTLSPQPVMVMGIHQRVRNR
jgi:hypothetical protein